MRTARLKSGVIAKIFAGAKNLPTPGWERLSFKRDENTRRIIGIKHFKSGEGSGVIFVVCFSF